MPKLDRGNYEINYVDYGTGIPVILIHGWPLSAQSWEYQIPAIVNAGFRCIAYDRKGFGKSSATWDEYDYSALAADVHALIMDLNLKEVILVGFSMGGGEVVRYLTQYGEDNISKIILISSIIPLVKQMDDNPNGVPEKDLQAIVNKLKTNRLDFLINFHKGFYNFDENKLKVSEAQLNFDFSVASHASPNATLKAALAWMNTDFREECTKINCPTLIIHGDADQTVPIATAGDQAHKLIKNAVYKVYNNAPHGLNITHKDKLNEDIISFLKN